MKDIIENVEMFLSVCNTDKERNIIELASQGVTRKDIGKHVGLHLRNVGKKLKQIRDRAAKKGYSPDHDMSHTVPDGYMVKGVSTYYNKEGKPSAQWVKSSVDMEKQQQFIAEAIEAMCEDIPKAKPVKTKKSEKYASELVNLVTFSDHHLGMLAWKDEGGSDWNLETAETMLTDCFSAMMKQTPNAETCIINNLGDFLHFDGFEAVTPTHRHILDADSRFPTIVRSAIRVLRQLITMALEKHEHVHVKMIEGNHDMSSSVWLREMFSAMYELEPRVTVDTSPKPYQIFEFGNVLLGFHHGHIKKSESLPLLFATEFSDVWGTTKFRYTHVGHRHHQEIKEHSGMTVEQHSTLASRDAHASRGGWHSGRKASCIVYHQEFGEVSRTYVTPEMLGYQ